MQVGRNKQSLTISLSANERAALGGSRCHVVLNPTSRTEWLILSGSDNPGDRSIYETPRNENYPYRLEIAAPDIPMFGTEPVECKAIGGKLYVEAPRMNKPLIERTSTPRLPPDKLSSMPGLEEVKQAVKIINNCKKTYGKQVEISVENDELRIRMMLEL